VSEEQAGVVVVVPIHRSAHLAQRAIESIVATVPAGTKILLVDDASGDADVDEMLAPSSLSRFGPERIDVIRNARNLGFPGTVNVALRAAGESDVVVVNSDVVVPPGWLQALVGAANTLPRAATLSVLANNGTMLSIPFRNEPSPSFPILQHADDLARGSAHLKPVEISNAIGHVLYLTRAAVKAVGDLDERYAPGYGEEVDFSLRASEAGFVNYVVPGIAVHHEGSGSFGFEREALIRRNARVVQGRYPYVWARAGEDESSTATALAGLLATSASSIRPVLAHLLGEAVQPRELSIVGTGGLQWTDQPAQADVVVVNITSDLPESLAIDRRQRIAVLFERTELVTRQWSHPDVGRWKGWLERVRTLCLSADAVLAREPGVVIDRGLASIDHVHQLIPASAAVPVSGNESPQAELLLGPIDSVEFLAAAAAKVAQFERGCVVGQPVPQTWCRAKPEAALRDGLGMSSVTGYRGRRSLGELRAAAGWPPEALVWAAIVDEVVWASGGTAELGTRKDSPWRTVRFVDGPPADTADITEVVRSTMHRPMNPVRTRVQTSASGDVLFLDPPPPIIKETTSGSSRRSLKPRSVLDSLRYEGLGGSMRKARRRIRGGR
jgi:GT2 family glycosyltransferase